MGDATCASCGTVLPAAAVLYDQQGNVKCQKCLMTAQVADSRKAVAAKVKGIAYGGPVIALVALVFNPFWLLTIGAIGNGLYVLRSVKDPQTAKDLGDSVEKLKVAAIAGMILGVVTGVARLFLMGGGGN